MTDHLCITCLAHSSRGLGHHPFTVETRIRIPYALQVLFSHIKDDLQQLLVFSDPLCFFRNKQSHLKCLDNSAGLECNPYKVEVVGSNPAQGTRSFFRATGNFLGHELIIEGISLLLPFL